MEKEIKHNIVLNLSRNKKKSLVKTAEGQSSCIKNASSFLRSLFLFYKINLATQAF